HEGPEGLPFCALLVPQLSGVQSNSPSEMRAQARESIPAPSSPRRSTDCCCSTHGRCNGTLLAMATGFEHVFPPELAWMRPFPMDGALLLFDRESGTNVLCDGPETAHLRQHAPRVVQFGITNHCNLACSFCSRDLEAESAWTLDDAFHILADLSRAGVLEVAFGGGEPWAFPRFADLVRRLHDQTKLAVNFTTNGVALTRARLDTIRGYYGQLRLSLYDDNDWQGRVAMLVDAGACFGINYLVTPSRLRDLETIVLRLAALGCRDVLLLSYNGLDRALHLDAGSIRELARRA